VLFYIWILPVTVFSPEIGNLNNLTSLDLRDCPIIDIPSEIGNLVNLTSLNLYKCPLIDLPSEIGNLVNLTSLNLTNCQLIDLPPEIGNLVNLTRLNLTNCQLIDLPPEIGNLVNLTRLDLCNCSQLIDLPPEIGNLVNLTSLELYYCPLTNIPPEIGNLVNLIKLKLWNCQLIDLPPEIKNLVNLTRLVFHNCPITNLPPEIGNLVNLTSLNLTNCPIIDLPPEIGNLVNLTSLNLTNCPIIDLPPEIGNLNNLTSLILHGCPIDYIQPNVQRLIDRIENRRREPIGGGVYDDRQSVHNHNIQIHIRSSVMNLLRDPKPPTLEQTVGQIIAHPNLTNETKEQLMEYIESHSVHSVLNVTFGETMCYVWKRIVDSEHCNEMLNILNTEMSDAHCMCFTGRISRLVNTLNGFYDDIVIRISDSEQIANIIQQTRVKLERCDEYSVDSHRLIVREMMVVLGWVIRILLLMSGFVILNELNIMFLTLPTSCF